MTQKPMGVALVGTGMIAQTHVQALSAAQDEQVRESIDDLSRVQLPFDQDSQTFPAMFVQDVERPERPAIICPVMHEVIRPDVITILRS